MKKLAFYCSALVFFCISLVVQANGVKHGAIKIVPIEHASFVMENKKQVIFVDPTGDKSLYQVYSDPDLILITDIHGDHFKPELIKSLAAPKTQILAPQAVVDKLGEGQVINNGESKRMRRLKITAIPMYNITESRLKYHPKGRGNGYLIDWAGQRIYISGDTEDTPEMRALKDIDIALICMNLPYTMTAKQAADAVIEMHPDIVIPYHFRGKNGFEDVDYFTKQVKKQGIQVDRLAWYP
ncbi:MBL fold metallo-hydrolase [Gayadomonas joobiniege]|uniref:MBL fold metallo-hydrolase n=1 Tax=Gayadomonas joobiniege TaxID=1234606 RepID=UPI0003637CE2|nr:MBL fold metallo-hydrolase [Gayadomonas joobiniege]